MNDKHEQIAEMLALSYGVDLLARALEISKSKLPKSRYTITCDGGSEGGGQEGPAYISYMVEDAFGALVLEAHNTSIGFATSPTAEYAALNAALTALHNYCKGADIDVGTAEVTVVTDSQLIVGHMQGINGKKWKVGKNIWLHFRAAESMAGAFGKVEFNKISGDEMKRIIGH